MGNVNLNDKDDNAKDNDDDNIDNNIDNHIDNNIDNGSKDDNERGNETCKMEKEDIRCVKTNDIGLKNLSDSNNENHIDEKIPDNTLMKPDEESHYENKQNEIGLQDDKMEENVEKTIGEDENSEESEEENSETNMNVRKRPIEMLEYNLGSPTKKKFRQILTMVGFHYKRG